MEAAIDPNGALRELREVSMRVIGGQLLSPEQQYHAADLIQGLDARLCNDGPLPRDWDPLPVGLVELVQRWADLRDERARVQEATGELDLDTLRQFEEEQEDAATEIADVCYQWFNELGRLR